MYQNILVINLMHLGDLMLATPVLRTLRTNFPQAKLTLLADKKLADLVVANRHLDECLLLDKKGKDNSLGSLIRFAGKLRRQKFDLVINLHRNERASFLAAFSGAKKIVGYAKPGFSLFFDEVMPNPSVAHHLGWGPGGILPPHRYAPGTIHQVTAHLNVLREIGVEKIDDGGLEMWLTPTAEERAAEIWQENFSPTDKVVALNIGASWETKRWPTAYFAEAADALLAQGYALAFFGGSMDEELVAECRAKMRHSASPHLKIFTGKVSLGELAGMLRRCCLFLTTDSGPMHVGVAMNVPIVTMFGASPVPGFYPYDAKDVLIKSPEPCHPCGIHRCPREGEENLACMKKIMVATVMNEVNKLLAKYQGKPAYELPEHYGEYQCQLVEA
ncbi:MAG: glycosyltransferase family 9 protein [Selenomonadaceae bacterium]|nr:glycosyltransferase family 9 protein [Selenomonadaceae bacterium]